MWVYGDRPRRVATRAVIAELAQRLAALEIEPAGVARHGSLVAAFILAGELQQGLADAAFEARGVDDVVADDPASALVFALGSAVARSWDSGFQLAEPPPEARLRALAAGELPAWVVLKTGEGYAYYALYPEAYLEAARRVNWNGPPLVVGLRSIGTTLAAMVAAGSGAESYVTVRPTGHPFDRRLSLSPALEAKLAEAGEVAVADEGPGLSGSSFASAARAAEAAGREPERIVFFPSHPYPPGSQASAAWRVRWDGARKACAGFDEIMLNDPQRGLAAWFADVAGEATAPLQDISGGGWRADPAIPAHPAQERRKFLLRTNRGVFLLKFAGLGAAGEAKFERAQMLHAGGFTPEPLAFRHGVLLERWHEAARPVAVEPGAMAERIGAYLRARTRLPAQDAAGASLNELHEMLRANLPTILGREVDAPAPPDVAARRVRTDGRMHRWEWLQLPHGRVLKTDALDHDDAHDLIGCQDIGWDVAGAEAEFDLDPAQTGRLAAAAGADPRLLEFHRIAYPAFQAALWSQAEQTPAVAALLARYRRRLETLLT